MAGIFFAIDGRLTNNNFALSDCNPVMAYMQQG